MRFDNPIGTNNIAGAPTPMGVAPAPMNINTMSTAPAPMSVEGQQRKPVSLAKGQKISLDKVAQDAGIKVTKVMCGLGWKVNNNNKGFDFDLDCQAFVCNDNRKVINDSAFIFYNQPQGFGVTHMGDNRRGTTTGEVGDAEQIQIDLINVPDNVRYIAITATIHEYEKRKQNFGMVSDAYIRIMDELTGIELCRYDLSEDFDVESAIVVGEIYRYNGEWKFNPVGSGYNGGLRALAISFGVDVE